MQLITTCRLNEYIWMCKTVLWKVGGCSLLPGEGGGGGLACMCVYILFPQLLTCTHTCNWGEPEWAPHSRVLKMSVCALLKVCLLLASHAPRGIGGSYCVVECHAITWRSWVRASQRQLLSFFFFCWCGRASCCNVKVMRVWASQRQLFFWINHKQLFLDRYCGVQFAVSSS